MELCRKVTTEQTCNLRETGQSEREEKVSERPPVHLCALFLNMDRIAAQVLEFKDIVL